MKRLGQDCGLRTIGRWQNRVPGRGNRICKGPAHVRSLDVSDSANSSLPVLLPPTSVPHSFYLQALASGHPWPIFLHGHLYHQVLSNGSKQLPYSPGSGYCQEATVAAQGSLHSLEMSQPGTRTGGAAATQICWDSTSN